MSQFESQNSTFHEIRAVVAATLDIPVDSIAIDSTTQSLGADSLDLIAIIMRLEEQFGIEIDDEAVASMHTIGDIVSYIDTLKVNQ